jgi:hypothetical protein
MKTLKYKGFADVREIGPGDAEGNNKSDVTWDASNHHTAEVSDATGQWLLDNEAGDWEDVTPEPAKPEGKQK